MAVAKCRQHASCDPSQLSAVDVDTVSERLDRIEKAAWSILEGDGFSGRSLLVLDAILTWTPGRTKRRPTSEQRAHHVLRQKADRGDRRARMHLRRIEACAKALDAIEDVRCCLEENPAAAPAVNAALNVSALLGPSAWVGEKIRDSGILGSRQRWGDRCTPEQRYSPEQRMANGIWFRQPHMSVRAVAHLVSGRTGIPWETLRKSLTPPPRNRDRSV